MPDRLEAPWIDVLAGRTDAAESARLVAGLDGDPAAVHAFESWRRLAVIVRDSAEARAHDLPSLAGVLAAIGTPARQDVAAGADGGLGARRFESPTELDRVGRATLRRLAAEPIVPAGAPHPVPAWVVGAAAVAAAVVLALWPTAHGPLGGVFVAALRQQAADATLAGSSEPTPIARLRDGAARLRRGAAGSGAAGSGAGDAGAGGPLASARQGSGDRTGVIGAPGRAFAPGDDDLRWPADLYSGSRPASGARSGAGRTRAGTGRPSVAGAAGGPGAPGSAPPVVVDPGGYPGPSTPSAAYPPPAPPAAAGRGGSGGRKPPKPSIPPPSSPTAVPTTVPTPEPPTAPPPTEPAATATPSDSRIVGTVVGEDGGGRAQVRIAAYRQGDGPIGDSWLETFTAHATGRYTLTLQPGAWLLYAEAPGHRPQWWSGADRPEDAQAAAAAGESTAIDWRLSAAGGGDGLVVGEASPHAWVRAVPEGADPTRSAGPSALADAVGRFALPLPAGRWAIARADDGRDRAWRALPGAVTVEAGTSTTVAWP